MPSFDYAADGFRVRDGIVAVHRDSWEKIANAGSHWTGAQRVEIARQARAARAARGEPPWLRKGLPDAAGRVDLAAAVRELGQRGCNEVLVECGSRLAGAFLQEGILDELVIYMAPSLLGSAARPLIELPIAQMADKVELEPVDVRRVGRDWRFTFIPG